MLRQGRAERIERQGRAGKTGQSRGWADIRQGRAKGAGQGRAGQGRAGQDKGQGRG